MNDAVLYLGALPLALFVLLVLSRWAWRGASEKARTRGAAAAAGTVAATAPAGVAATEAAGRHVAFRLLASGLNTPLGATAGEALDAVEAGRPRPRLDSSLSGPSDLPVLTARIEGLDPDAVSLAPLEAEVEAPAAFVEGRRCRPEVRRALAALVQPIEQVLAALASQQAAPAPTASDGPAGAAMASAKAGAGSVDRPSAPQLVVLCAWPAEWAAGEAQVGCRWVEREVLQAGAGGMGLSQTVFVACTPSAEQPAWLQAEQWLHRLHREQQPGAVLLLAASSQIGSDSVQRLRAAGRLFDPSHPQGVVPGEAACALLLATAGWPVQRQGAAPLLLHRAAAVRRDKAVDAGGRANHGAAQAAVEQAVLASALPVEAITAAVTDADQHGPRAAEALSALLAPLPHLQPAADVASFGEFTGAAGVTAVPLAVALAAERCKASSQPCLALSLDDPHLRVALVVRGEAASSHSA